MNPKFFMRAALCLLLVSAFASGAAASVALSEHSLFVIDRDSNMIVRVDPDSGSVLDSFAAPADVYKAGLASDGTSLFFATSPGEVFVLDPDTGATRYSFLSPVDAAPFGVSALAFGSTFAHGPVLFGLSSHNDLILLFDPLSGDLLEVISAPVDPMTSQPVNFTDGLDFNPRTGTIFVGDFINGFLHEIDPNTGILLNTFPPPGLLLSGIGFIGDRMFAVDRDSDTIFELDPSDGSIIAGSALPTGSAITNPFGLTGFDGAPPSLTPPPDVLVECESPTGQSVALGVPNVFDPFDSMPDVSNNAPGVFFLGMTTVIWTATDISGNSVSAPQRVEVVDTQGPIITLVGANPQIVECGAAYMELGASALDACEGDLGGSITIDASDVDTALLGDYVVSYFAIDSSENSAVKDRTVRVVDTTPPVIALLGANPLIVECPGPYIDPGASVTDNCSQELDAVVGGQSVDPTVPATYTVTYNAVDDEGNPAAQLTRTVIVQDTTPPVIALLGANPLIVECPGPYVDPGASVTDNCSQELDAVVGGQSVDPTVPATYTVTYNAVDDEGNPAAQLTRTVIVQDTTPPVIALLGANPLIVECPGPYVDPGASVTDNCSQELDAVVGGQSVDPTVPATYTVTYNAVDDEGNPAAQLTRTVIVQDTTPPVIALLGANPLIVECPGPYVDPGASVTDNCSQELDAVVGGQSVDPTVPATYTVTYNAVDDEGNPAAQLTRTVIVQDTTPPVIALLGANPLIVECPGPYIDPGASVTDNCSQELDAVVGGQTVDPTVPATYTVTYNAVDDEGNPAAQLTRTVIVQDTTPPVIALLGANPLIVECPGPYIDPGASVTDNCSQELDAVVGGQSVDPTVPATYTVTYNAVDDEGNPAAQLTRTVIVQDTTPPVIALLGANPLIVECPGPYIDPGASVTDNCSQELDAVVGGQTVDPTVPATYTVTYNAVDDEGNPAAQLTRTVIVQDTTPPVIALLGANPLIVECPGPYVDPGASVTDNCSQELDAVVGGQSVDPTVPATYTVTYNAVDDEGNPAAQLTRTVIVQDTTPPVIALLGANPLIVECPGPYVDPGASVTDNCSQELDAVVGGQSVDPTVPATYTVTYNAVDDEGNPAAQLTRTVEVRDSVAPTISCPANISVNNDAGLCGAVVNYAVTFNDNCPGATLNQTAGLPSDSLFPVGTTTNTFVVTDIAGLTATCSFDVTVADTEPPVITCPDDIITQCESPAGAVVSFTVTATDNCGLATGGTSPSPLSGGTEGVEVATSPFATVDFTQPSYVTDLNDLLTFDVQITYDPANPGTDDLFGYGVRLVPDAGASFDTDPGNILITPVPELNFDAFNGPLASVDKDPAVLGVKGTVDVLSGPAVPYTGSVIATFGLRFLTEGVFTFGLDFFNTLGPTEMIFVTGDGVTLDPGISFGTATVTVGEGTPTGVVCVPPSGSTFPLGVTTVVCTATDIFGNMSTCNFDVTVEDTTPPVLTLVGANPQVIECNAPYTELGATATDACEGALSPGFILIDASAVNTAVPGDYTVTYNVSDSLGNAAMQLNRTVSVVDTAPPALVDLQIGPDSVNVTDASAIVNCFITVDDCILQIGTLRVLDPSGAPFTSTTFFDAVTVPPETSEGEDAPEAAQGFSVDVTIPEGSLPGTYTVEVDLEDKDNPMVTYGGTTGLPFPSGAESSFVVTPGPPNDDFANSIDLGPVDVSPVKATGGNVDATLEPPDEPLHGSGCIGPVDSSVWWTFTAANTGVYEIDTFGSDFDTVLDIYTGPTLNSLSFVAENGNSGGTLQSSVRINATAGTTYHIAVTGENGEEGAICLNIAFLLPPPNDDFSNRIDLGALDVGPSKATGSNVLATLEPPNEPPHLAGVGTKSVWWTFTAFNTAQYEINTAGSDFNSILSVYTDTGMALLTELILEGEDGSPGGPGESLVLINATAGTTYHIAVTGEFGAEGAICLNIIGSPPPLPPINDDFGSATSLGSINMGFKVTGTNVGATLEPPDEPAHGGGSLVPVTGVDDSGRCDTLAMPPFVEEIGGPPIFPPSNSLISSFVTGGQAPCPAFNGVDPEVTVSIINSSGRDFTDVWYVADQGTTLTNFDGVIASHGGVHAFKIDALGANAPLIFESSAPDGIWQAGETWEFVIQDFNGADPPSLLGSNGIGINSVETAGAFSSGSIVVPATAVGTKSVWWSVTAGFDDALDIETFGSDFDTILSVYTGSELGNLSLVDENDDSGGPQSSVRFFTTPGTTYYIAVTGASDAMGSICLTIDAINLTPPAEVDFSEWTDAFDLEGAEAEPGADPDMDGDSNLYEAFAGSDPTDATSTNAPAFSLENGYLTLSVTRGPNAILGLGCDAQAAESDMPWSGSAEGETVILEDSPALFKARDARPLGDCPGRVFRIELSLE